jgi:galactonate dehydratase
MHLAAAVPNVYILEQMEPQRAMRDRASNVPIRYEDGHMLLPEGPGLGIEPNLDALAEMSFRPQPMSDRAGSLYW